MAVDRQSLDAALGAVMRRLLERRTPEGHWKGHLSSSALATATAAFALATVNRAAHVGRIEKALGWLLKHQNADGGWGDTVVSKSNLSTTLLAWSALTLARADLVSAATEKAQDWLAETVGTTGAEAMVRAVRSAYGADKSFSAPILTMCALAGRLGQGRDVWRHVEALPFELGTLSHSRLRRMRLPVVSYALPALIAVGQVRHHFLPAGNLVRRTIRNFARSRTLARLVDLQPASGGYIEAIPLTSFVAMSLAAMGRRDHPAVGKAVEFLNSTARPDGSWPIDTNLSTWVTTLAVNALAAGPRAREHLAQLDRQWLRDWLLAAQHRRVHAYTGAEPGGWAWTDASGGVPDADDTAGAMLALKNLQDPDQWPGGDMTQAVRTGADWLMGLQNRDGGVPTFCRGWGNLAFDRSSPDLTAHALLAWKTWRSLLPATTDEAMDRAVKYLQAVQRPDGSWSPLWFGNENSPDLSNGVYGTARVIEALGELAAEHHAGCVGMLNRGAKWLTGSQNADGGWGGGAGGSSIEETALGIGSLAGVAKSQPKLAGALRASVDRGLVWLLAHTQGGTAGKASAIGLYFARLWYYEELYPLIFTAWALGRAREMWGEETVAPIITDA